MSKETLVAFSAIALITVVVVVLMPYSDTPTAAVTADDSVQYEDYTEFCQDAVKDLVRLSKMKQEIPELMDNYDFQQRFKTAQSQVKACY